MFRNAPLCEVCKTRPATVIVGFRRDGEARVSAWQFTCSSERALNESEAFSIEDAFSNSDAIVDRLAHLQESGRVDWQVFMDMIVRLRDASRNPIAP